MAVSGMNLACFPANKPQCGHGMEQGNAGSLLQYLTGAA